MGLSGPRVQRDRQDEEEMSMAVVRWREEAKPKQISIDVSR